MAALDRYGLNSDLPDSDEEYSILNDDRFWFILKYQNLGRRVSTLKYPLNAISFIVNHNLMREFWYRVDVQNAIVYNAALYSALKEGIK